MTSPREPALLRERSRFSFRHELGRVEWDGRCERRRNDERCVIMAEDVIRGSQLSMKAAALRVLDLPLSVFSSVPLVSLSSSSGKLLAATAFGAISLVFLARHFRRRKGRRKKAAQTRHDTQTDTYNFITLLPAAGKDVYCRDHNLNLSLNSKKDVFCHVASNSSLYSELSGSLQSLTSAKSVNACSCCSCCNGSSCWDRADAGDLRNAVGLPIATPQNLHLMGMELFEEALRRWEQALTFRGTPVEDEASCDLVEIGAGDLSGVAEESVEDIITADFIQKLESLLQRAYRLKEEFEGALGMSEPSSLPSSEILTDVSVMEDTDDSCIRDSMSIASTDSFVSAAELPELRTFGHYPFYEEALQLARDGHISCRVLRTEMLDCLDDLDFLAKLYCVRQACQAILCERATRMFLAETGKKILSSIIVKARKSPKMFEEVFEEMIRFLERTDHWENTEVELATRGVNHLNFYDIVLDFILMDSFEDLESPPKSIQNVINNRWLNSAFKETAVASSCWSVLKQKRQLMKVPDGFIAHFYAVCEHISPVLAWGFLGPRSPLHDFCCFFKEQVLFFLKDIFDLEKVRYTTVETLTEDVLRLLHRRSELLLAYLGADSLRRVNICTGPMPQIAHGTLLETPVQ